jgi:hypothetical protein
MGYAHIQCYVMSGTGNGWRAARQLHASSQAAGVPCAVTPINHADPLAEIGDDPQHLWASKNRAEIKITSQVSGGAIFG